MIFSENRFPLFRIMLYRARSDRGRHMSGLAFDQLRDLMGGRPGVADAERSDMHTGLSSTKTAPAIGAEGLLRAPARARGRVYPPIRREGEAGHPGQKLRGRSGRRCRLHAIVPRKPRAGFFLSLKNLRPTLDRPGTGVELVFSVLRYPLTRRSSGLTSESGKLSRA